eukprot:283980-Alexandrium_andersonii.AAC.1
MSASLVGSEMCIRDRPSVALVASLAVALAVALVVALAAAVAAALAVLPVSYTHLTLPTICSV